jgi:hypothetical protein
MTGGTGLEAFGATGAGDGGTGIKVTGGAGGNGFGGTALEALGGNSSSADAGIALAGFGGENDNGNGGTGLYAEGGIGKGIGNFGGFGLFVTAGFGTDGADEGLAAFLQGDVEVFAGSLSVKGNFSATGTKMFKIDHPLDPENKYLNHAAIESSEVLNVYSGNITTDQNGDAIVTLPDWFEALNKDFRYQLTVVGTFAQAIVADEIRSNRFAIKTNAPKVKVSWQVTGVRNDRGMRKQPFKVEEIKAERERGHYLQPEAFDQTEEMSIQWARYPERMQQIKQRRIKTEQTQLEKQPNRR